MNYKSTRDINSEPKSSAEVIKQGLSADGGLFVPESIPTLSEAEILELCYDSYPVRAAKILSKYLSDYTYDELLADCTEAYNERSFEGGAAQLVHTYGNIYSLELWHGPTAAFKDMALQIMPRLLSRALTKTGEERNALILVATSGDTGKAALEGYRDIDKINMMVFYPAHGVSQVQRLQMATQEGSNVNVVAIEGNFDNAQSGVKEIFSNPESAKILDENGYFFSSANSINWGRLAPQIVYYISAYCDLLADKKINMGDKINVCVPTGNFGNIFAAYLAKLMGLPIAKLICASNKNNILTDFLRTGTYDRNRSFHLTMSPSMDILISSNLERLLYFTAGYEKTVAYMKDLNVNGAYTVDAETMEKINESFIGYFADEETTSATIKDFYKNHNYLSDTHTAVALNSAEQYIKETGDTTPIVVASTASPYKFAIDVYKSLAGEFSGSDLEALDALSALTGTEITYPLRGLNMRELKYNKIIDHKNMLDEVYSYIKK